jgi:hypothetical protein
MIKYAIWNLLSVSEHLRRTTAYVIAMISQWPVVEEALFTETYWSWYS